MGLGLLVELSSESQVFGRTDGFPSNFNKLFFCEPPGT